MDKLERNNLGLAILLILLVVSTALTLVFVVLPLVLSGATPCASSAAQAARARLLPVPGFGFILVEIGFMQRFVLFLGHRSTRSRCAGDAAAASASAARCRAARPALRRPRLARRAIAALAVLMTVYALALGPVFHALLGAPLRAHRAVRGAGRPARPAHGVAPASGVRTANALGPDLVPGVGSTARPRWSVRSWRSWCR